MCVSKKKTAVVAATLCCQSEIIYFCFVTNTKRSFLFQFCLVGKGKKSVDNVIYIKVMIKHETRKEV
jgi:hypothetical protein